MACQGRQHGPHEAIFNYINIWSLHHALLPLPPLPVSPFLSLPSPFTCSHLPTPYPLPTCPSPFTCPHDHISPSLSLHLPSSPHRLPSPFSHLHSSSLSLHPFHTSSFTSQSPSPFSPLPQTPPLPSSFTSQFIPYPSLPLHYHLAHLDQDTGMTHKRTGKMMTPLTTHIFLRYSQGRTRK